MKAEILLCLQIIHSTWSSVWLRECNQCTFLFEQNGTCYIICNILLAQIPEMLFLNITNNLNTEKSSTCIQESTHYVDFDNIKLSIWWTGRKLWVAMKGGRGLEVEAAESPAIWEEQQETLSRGIDREMEGWRYHLHLYKYFTEE